MTEKNQICFYVKRKYENDFIFIFIERISFKKQIYATWIK